MSGPTQGTSTSLRLTEILIREKLITEEQLQKALDVQKRTPDQQIGAILVKAGTLKDKDLALALSKTLNIPYANRESDLLTPAADQGLNKLLTEEFCRKNHIVPLYRHANALKLAMADPTNVILLDNLRLMTDCYVQRIVASYSDI